MKTLDLDLETFSELDLKEVGIYRYAEEAEVMLILYGIDDGPEQYWDHSEGKPLPADLLAALANSDVEVTAHNSMFDRTTLRLGNLKIGVPIERWNDTMVQAMQHALPGSLDELGRVLGLPEDQRKLAEGKRLIQRFCKPAPRNHKAARYTRDTHPDEWQQFIEYGLQDIRTMRAVRKLLPTWNWKRADIEQWHLDQVINDRGFKVDLGLVRAGAAAAEQEKALLETRFRELTGLSPTQREKVKDFIADNYGLQLEATAKHIMQPIAEDDELPATLREIAHIMLAANKSSTAKYAKLDKMVSSDGRFRGGLQFSGATRTRRWAGRGFQPQNLPSRGLPKEAEVNTYIDALKAGVHAELFDNLMLFGAAALRGVLIA